jgi:hypothetical protein
MTGNGLLDIYLLNTTAFMGPESDPDRLLLNEGKLKFRDVFGDSNASNFGAGRSVVWLDAEGNGQYSAYVCNYAEPCRLFVLRNGKLRNIAPELALNQVTGGRSACTWTNPPGPRSRRTGGLRLGELGRAASLDETIARWHVQECCLRRAGNPLTRADGHCI